MNLQWILRELMQENTENQRALHQLGQERQNALNAFPEQRLLDMSTLAGRYAYPIHSDRRAARRPATDNDV